MLTPWTVMVMFHQDYVIAVYKHWEGATGMTCPDTWSFLKNSGSGEWPLQKYF